MPARKTCGGRPGSQGHEFQDAAQYARWGVDYLKYDWCNTGEGGRSATRARHIRRWRARLPPSGRPIVLSICEWGDNKPWLWGRDYGHLWRTTGDITNCWDCVVSHGNWFSSGVLPILDRQDALRGYAGPGRWNDPDMLEVGNLPTLADESRALRDVGDAGRAADHRHRRRGTQARGSRRAHQPAAGRDRPGRARHRGVQVDHPAGARHLGEAALRRPRAVALLNRGDAPRGARIDWAAADLNDALKGRRADFAAITFRLTDAWTGQAAGTTASPLERTLAPHDTLVFTLDPA